MAKEKPAGSKEPAAEAAADKASPEKKAPAEKPARKPKADKAAPEAPAAAAPVAEASQAVPEAAPAQAPSPPPGGEKRRKPGVAPRRGKKLRNHLKNQEQKLAKEGSVPLKRAVQLLKTMKRAKFDETVEIHMKLGVDASQADQSVRGSVPLPHGLGKVKRIVVFCQGDNVTKAKEAGADFAGGDELIAKIQGEGWLDFDVALATQDMMGKVSRLGKVLGPRGLMPTPKAGTVITANQDVAAAIREQKAGKVEYRADKGGNVHGGIGKLSFDEEKLSANVHAFIEQIRAAKPAGVKGHYILSCTLSATMSPGVPVAL